MHCIPHTASTKKRISLSKLGKPQFQNRRDTRIEGNITLWKCGRCRKFFPRDGFYKNKRTILGLTSECRKCHSEVSIASRDPVLTRKRKVKDQANRNARMQGRKVSLCDYEALSKILGDACQHCGSRISLQWDHVLPLACGGLHHPTNIQRLCRKCNEKKQKSCLDFRTAIQIRSIRKRWAITFRKL